MRMFVLSTLCVVMTLSAAAQQDAGWEQVGQAEWPYRPSVQEIVRNSDGDLLACPFGDGLYLSADDGAMWTPVDIDIDLPECTLAENETGALFAGTESGVYRSEDGGSTWTLAGLERWIYDLEYSPDGHLWTIAHEGDFDRVLFRSEDAVVWDLVADEASIGADFVGSFRYVSFSPEGDVFLGTQFGLFRSTDDGASWEQIVIDESRPGVVPSTGVVFTTSGIAYMGTATWALDFGRGGYRSTDGGVTWNLVTAPGLFVETFAVSGDGTVLAGTRGGLYGSTDGFVWEPAGLNDPRYRVNAITTSENGEPTFVGTTRGVYREKGMAEWERASEGFERSLVVYEVAVGDGSLFASANGEVYRYDSAEDRWRLPENAGLPSPNGVREVVLYGGALLLGTSDGLYQSEDVGETWEALWLAGEEERLSAFTILSSGAFVLGATTTPCCAQVGRLLFSTDEGTTWTTLEGWGEQIPSIISETPYGTLLVGTAGIEFGPDVIYRSEDGGETWDGTLEAPLRDIAVSPSGTVVGAGQDAHFRSVDDGLTWEQTDDVGGFSLTAAPNGGFAVIRDPSFYYIRDIYYSVDEGASWTQVSTELSASALATDAESFIYAGTEGQGVFRSSTSLAVSSESGFEGSPTFALAPAYPNPFAATARVPFTLSEPGPITLTVHDVLGRSIATLVDAVLPSGEHTATWESGTAASGVYVVTLRAGGRVATQRITVAR